MSLPHDEVIPILDFGSQTAQLIARRVREAGAFSTLIRPDTPAAEIEAMKPIGIILSGGPASVYAEGAPTFDPSLLDLGVPVLGICYGMQVGCDAPGQRPSSNASAPRVRTGSSLSIITDRRRASSARVPEHTTAWMSTRRPGHQTLERDDFDPTRPPPPTCPYAAVRCTRPTAGASTACSSTPRSPTRPTAATSSPTSSSTSATATARGRWPTTSNTRSAASASTVGDQQVICGLSGGVDSARSSRPCSNAPSASSSPASSSTTASCARANASFVETTFRDHFDIDLRVVDAKNSSSATSPAIQRPPGKTHPHRPPLHRGV